MSTHRGRAALRVAISFASSLTLAFGFGAIVHADTRIDLLAAFDATAMNPVAPLIQGADGNLYGTASAGGPANAGAIVQITTSGSINVLYAFSGGADGAYPYGGLVVGADGSFYGTTSQGGAAGAGTIFRITPAGDFSIVHSFDGIADGAYPYGGLVRAADGSLFGTASSAGLWGAGTAFNVLSDGTFSIVYAFTGADDGAYPYAGLVQGSDGNLYGTTYVGGPSGAGTIFQVTPAGALTTLYAFTGGADGAYPYAGVIVGTDGALYGVASQGGANAQGSVFQLAPDGTFTVLHDFAIDGIDGTYPIGGLIQAADGTFYGTTLAGGAAGVGTLFSIGAGGSYSLLYAFTGGDDGGYPYAGLVQTADGSFYGTVAYGGNQGDGTAFRLSVVPSLVTWAAPAPIVYGSRLGAAQLDATASVPGTFVYSPAAGTLLHAGNQVLTVVFTPSDPALPVTTSTTILTVLPATPVVRWSDPGAVAYGTPLGAAQLNARANVRGVFAYDPGAGSILDVGTQTLSATFFPSSGDYMVATASVSLVVTPAAPVITWTPAAIAYGTALGALQLNAVANTPGTFVYAQTAGTVLPLGVQTLTATFTPADSINYVTTTASATVNVAEPSASGGGNEHPLQFTAIGAKGLTIAGYALAPSPVYGTVVIGNCSYYTQTSGSGRGGGYKTVTTYHYQTCTWDVNGELVSVVAGAPTAPAPLSINGTQTIYASDPASGIYAGTDSAVPTRGFVFTPGSHYTWLTSNASAVLAQTVTTVTVTLKSDGNLPLGVASAQASALAGVATVTSTTCTDGAIAVGSTCSVTVSYDPTRLQSTTGLAYDTLTIHVNADSGQTVDWSQRYTIQLTPANTNPND